MKPKSAARHVSFHHLLEALAWPGCPACWLASASVAHSLAVLSYERINDPEVQVEFRRARGLCALHGWKWYDRLQSGQGMAILYRVALRGLAEDLRRVWPERGDGFLGLRALLARAAPSEGAAAAALRPEALCALCRERDESAARAIGVLLDHLGEGDVRTAYERSPGLCLPHLRVALEHGTGRRREAARYLVNHTLERVQSLLAELSEYIRKHDYRFQNEPFGPEADSPARALAFFIGERGVW